ncbi:hypothetical protein L3X38_036825 [Prunus dulcis]|uniref:Uncharacterized protein n=1 Tax=Prunus dulcis TaxID=3755 RepID=A0AAD4V2H6_PRUDU|nr:hypothetical protein L3X38_036825 [Prunus dulcis]
MLVRSSQVQPQPEKRPRQEVCYTESSRGETRPVLIRKRVYNTAPIRKKVCSTEPIWGVFPPEPDRETMRVKDGYFAWEPLDSGDDSDEGDDVLCMVEDEYCSLMAASWKGRKGDQETF